MLRSRLAILSSPWRAAALAALALVLLLGALFVWQPWTSAEGPRPREGFAADRIPARVEFDGKRAMKYLDDVCKIGPRMSGTDGMKKQQELIQKHFEGLGATVTYQRFTARQRSKPREVNMANMVISYHPDRKARVILCSHYDTRPIADQEPDRRRWRDPFVSANDGGSGVAFLMELAHHMKGLKTEFGVDFVFFDGEEYVWDGDDVYFFGSKHFAREWTRTRRATKVNYKGAVLLDMIAGKNARFPVEQNSAFKAGKLVKEVWGIAEELGCKRFLPAFSKVAVEDDHIPLNNAGIPAIDIIDFDYPHWHRLTDVPANCSAEPMIEVARVLAVWLQRVR